MSPTGQQPARAAEHVALLGDSIFDNAAYVPRGRDVVSHLRSLLPAEWRATLYAVDGATTSALQTQVARVPQDVTQIIVSIGGNDALQNIDLLSMRVTSSAAALEAFGTRLGTFERNYRDAIDAVLALGPPVTICTIYNGALEPDQADIARVALTLFNDVVLRTAFDNGLDVIELRTVCCERADYANPIEPSDAGGRKIAEAIAATLGLLPKHAWSRVWALTPNMGR